MNNLLRLSLIAFSIMLLSMCVEEKSTFKSEMLQMPSGDYLGQALPGDSAVLFAPGVISTELYTRDITFTPDGNEIYFCISAAGYNLIYSTKQVEGKWTMPEVASFVTDDEYMYYEPHITHDGQTLLFLSNMPADSGEAENQDIWAVDRRGDSWGKPYNLGAPINTDGAEFYPSTTKDGTLYFTRAEAGSRINAIYRSKKINGQYQTAEKLGPEVNCGTNRYNATIDPHERFIIVPALGMEDSRGGTDYYISFRNEDDTWTDPVNMGDQINSENGREYSASLSRDGQYLFFMSSKTLEAGSPDYTQLREKFTSPWNGNSNIYWIKSDFIWDLKKKLD